MPYTIPRLPIADQTWRNKYKYNSGANADATIQDSWKRVASALASVEKEPLKWTQKFYSALQDFKFLPAGRILSGAGTGRRVTLHNCFVMDRIDDSMKDIFRNLGEAAITMQAGGGIGYDFSSLRPKGSPVLGVDSDASGPLSFMECWNSMCKTVMSAGSRRGAMMATLRCDHPDIEAFITTKRTPGVLTNFNLSVLATDDFMEAVQNDLTWDLVFGGKVYKTIQARDLWSLIMRTTYEVAEPGVIFIDQINARNNLYYCESISATNPCGEQPLPPYGTCLLGSINFAALVQDAFGKSPHIDQEQLKDTVFTAVRMMDNVVEASWYPVERQKEEAVNKRRIGLGVTGLADALAMCGLTYGTPDAVKTTRDWMRAFQSFAYEASVELAKEKGPFPFFDAKQYIAGKTIQGLPHYLVKAIGKHGIRNALVTSIAPTGTISLYADNVSSGIEPIFAREYSRKTLQSDGSKAIEIVTDYALRLFNSLYPGRDIPAQFVTAQDLKVDQHLSMQAAVQDYIDSSISKTINVPEDYPFDDFAEIYLKAYKAGCKGCTTYRPSPARGSVLEVTGGKAPAAEPPKPTVNPRRPKVLPGVTSKLKWNDDPSYFLTLNVKDGVPYEIFINSKSTTHKQWTDAVSRLVTAIFHRGGDISFLANELMQVTDPNGGAWIDKKYVPSLVALLGHELQSHLVTMGVVAHNDVKPPEAPAAEPVREAEPKALGETCPKCSAPTLIRKEGCKTCQSCGYSSCG